ncbi:hypothetical protein ATCC90586_005404 [Pythium insidiosum]|nr:hypothetical protein ATCC90586_005404 [Pythium insidiosum]
MTIKQRSKSDYVAVETPRGAPNRPRQHVSLKQPPATAQDKRAVSLRDLYRFATPRDYAMLCMGCLLATVSGILYPCMALVFGHAIAAFDPFDQDGVNEAALEYFAIAVALFVADFAAFALFAALAEGQVKLLREMALRRLLHLDVSWFDEHSNSTQQLVSRITGDTLKIKDGMGQKLGDAIKFMAQFAGGYIIGFWKSWDLALVMCTMTPVMAGTLSYLLETIRRSAGRTQKLYAEAGGVAEETLSSIRTITTLNAEPQAINRFKEKVETVETANIALFRRVGMINGIFTASLWLMNAIGVWYGGYKVYHSQLAPSTVFQAFFGIVLGSNSLALISPNISAVAEGIGAAAQLYEILDTTPDIDASREIDASTSVPSQCNGDVVIEGVHFAYPSRAEAPKQRIAIARAIIRDPKILVLDEATSALDNESERVVQAALTQVMQDAKRTTIVIAHRLSTVRSANKIVVMMNGMVHEQGTHEELMQIPGGVYREILPERRLFVVGMVAAIIQGFSYPVSALIISELVATMTHLFAKFLVSSDATNLQDIKHEVTDSFVVFATYALVFWYGGSLVSDGKISFKELLRSLMAIIMSAQGIGFGLSWLGEAQHAFNAGTAILQLRDYPRTINGFATDRSNGCEFEASMLQGCVEFRNVTFRYPTRPEVTVLDGFNLSVEPNQTIGICGPSGGGKSTIVSLLERFYDPESGQVLLDGHDLRELKVQWLRGQIGYVGQEPTLFMGTIAENIAYGLESRSEADRPTQQDIERAARLANAHDFISNLPEGYATQVGAKGEQLSGGQKQRIAIARALLRNPKLLILDEATSALDSESERIVQQALDEVVAARARTTIVIAHRLSTIRNADKIVVVERGRVVEQGTHSELMRMPDGTYHRLHLYPNLELAQAKSSLRYRITSSPSRKDGENHILSAAVADIAGAKKETKRDKMHRASVFGLYSIREIMAVIRLFWFLDVDRSGGVTLEEIRRHEGFFSGLGYDDVATVFSEMDKDGNGVVTLRELLRLCFRRAKHHQLDAMVTLAKVGNIQEYLAGQEVSASERMATADAIAQRRLELLEIFRLFDRNGDGKVSMQELLQALHVDEQEQPWAVGSASSRGWSDATASAAAANRARSGSLTKDDVARFYREYDKNGDEELDFDEFLRLMESSFGASRRGSPHTAADATR